MPGIRFVWMCSTKTEDCPWTIFVWTVKASGSINLRNIGIPKQLQVRTCKMCWTCLLLSKDVHSTIFRHARGPRPEGAVQLDLMTFIVLPMFKFNHHSERLLLLLLLEQGPVLLFMSCLRCLFLLLAVKVHGSTHTGALPGWMKWVKARLRRQISWDVHDFKYQHCQVRLLKRAFSGAGSCHARIPLRLFPHFDLHRPSCAWDWRAAGAHHFVSVVPRWIEPWPHTKRANLQPLVSETSICNAQ